MASESIAIHSGFIIDRYCKAKSQGMKLVKPPLFHSCLNFKHYGLPVCFIETRKTAFGIISTVKKPRPSEADDDSLPACKKAKCEG